MFDITLTIQAPDLVRAAQLLAEALSSAASASLPRTLIPMPTSTPAAESSGAVAPATESAAIQPPQAPELPPQTLPPQPQNVPPQPTAPAVPTAAQSYSQEQLARAGAMLMDAGRMQDLLGLLAQFGVQAITQLPKEQYGAFATALRAMGAKL